MVKAGTGAAALLELVQERIDGISPLDLNSVMTLAADMSPLSGNIMELHFDKCLDRVDFATRISKQFDAALIPGCRLPFATYGLKGLIGEYDGIENIWIEYDAPFTRPPALFFDLYRQAAFCPQRVYKRLQEITGGLGYPLTPRLLNFLELLQQLALRVVYYGCMFSRQSRSIRLTIHGITPSTLTTRLRQLGWNGNYQALDHLRVSCLHAEQQLVVGVDVEEETGARIGIEVFDKDPETFIHTLYKNGRISAGDAALVMRWPGCRLLPADLSHVLTQLQQRPAHRLYTRINHFKFVVDDTDLTAVKGYLYYCY
jgi:hypothetical protein